MANVKQTTVTGTVAGAPYPPHALPNTVTPASKALWVQAGTVANVATINQFVLANGGPGGVIFVAFKGQAPATMRGLSVAIAASVNGSGPPTTALALARPLLALSGGRLQPVNRPKRLIAGPAPKAHGLRFCKAPTAPISTVGNRALCWLRFKFNPAGAWCPRPLLQVGNPWLKLKH